MPRTLSSLAGQTGVIALLAGLSIAAAPATASAPPAATHDAASPWPRELFLAGGALGTCTSLAPSRCVDAATVGGTRDGQPARTPPVYALDDAGLAELDGPHLLAELDPATRGALRATARALRAREGLRALDGDALWDAFAATCVDADGGATPCARDAGAAWARLDDDTRAGVLSAFEQPQRAADGAMAREHVDLDGGVAPWSALLLRAFVEAAAARAPGRRPRIAVVTASAHDPFDAVDAHVAALAQAGADAAWWPLDPALAAALDAGDCASLPARRRDVLRLAGRERVAPALVAAQDAACRAPAALAAVAAEVDGVFLAGGDQWKHRAAFVFPDGRPRPWLATLQRRVAAGEVVVFGTSAGTAVQSGVAMVGNGDPAAALARGVHAGAPPRPGCARAGTCPPGVDEDALSAWAPGGLGFAPGFSIDTHFSERAREARLLVLLAAHPGVRGLGVDEASALHLAIDADGGGRLRALGASGGWLFEPATCADGGLASTVHALGPGGELAWAADGAISAQADLAAIVARAPPRASATATADARLSGDALADGALRAAADALADGAAEARLFARHPGGEASVRLARPPATTAFRAPGAGRATATALRLAIAPLACPLG